MRKRERMRKIGYMVIIMIILASIIAAGIILPAQSTVSNDEKYAVGGEITPINETPFILNPYALAAIATVIVVIAASIALKKFPVKIVIEKA